MPLTVRPVGLHGEGVDEADELPLNGARAVGAGRGAAAVPGWLLEAAGAVDVAPAGDKPVGLDDWPLAGAVARAIADRMSGADRLVVHEAIVMPILPSTARRASRLVGRRCVLGAMAEPYGPNLTWTCRRADLSSSYVDVDVKESER